MFDWAKTGSKKEVSEFRIEDNRNKSSIDVFLGNKRIGYIFYSRLAEQWKYKPEQIPWSDHPHPAYTESLGIDYLEELADKLRELNDE